MNKEKNKSYVFIIISFIREPSPHLTNYGIITSKMSGEYINKKPNIPKIFKKNVHTNIKKAKINTKIKYNLKKYNETHNLQGCKLY